MKKVLALVVAFALCFTAFTGCFATSAAALDNFAVSSVEVAADAQAAAVTVSGTYSGKAVQLLTVTLPEGVALDSVEGAKELTDTQDGEYIVTGNVVKFLDVPNNAFTYILKVTFAANTSETDAVAYEVAADVEYALYDEEKIEYANAKGTITVAAVEKEEPEVPAEPVLDENIQCEYGSGLSETAYVTFQIIKSSLKAEYASYDLVVTRNKADSEYNFVSDTKTIAFETANDSIPTSTKHWFYYRGVELYSLTVEISAVLYCKDAEGNVIAYSKPFVTTMADALKATYATTKNELLKTTIADVIYAGAEVQKYFTKDKNTESDYNALPLPSEGFTGVGTAELGALATYNDLTGNGTYVITPGGAVDAAPYLSFNVATIPYEERGNYTIKLSYYDVVLEDDVVKEINLADEGVLQTANNTKHWAYFRNMSMYATNAEVTAELYVEGTADAISTISYCFDSFIELRKTHATLGPVVIALGKMGQSFRTLKGK